MREELIKFDRYQKQFHFLIDNDIETPRQLAEIKQKVEDKISKLILRRSKLYRNPDAKGEITDIKAELKELRAKVRMCNNILTESERIAERYHEAQRLEQEAIAEHSNKNKPKSKDKGAVITR